MPASPTRTQQSWFTRPLAGWACVLGWCVATGIFIAGILVPGGPAVGDAYLIIYPTWAVSHGQFVCMYPPHPPVSPVCGSRLPADHGAADSSPASEAAPPSRPDRVGHNCDKAVVAMVHWSEQAGAVFPTSHRIRAWLFLVVRDHAAAGCREGADWLGAHRSGHRGLPSSGLVVHRDVRTPARCRRHGFRLGRDGVCAAQSVGRRRCPHRAGGSHPAVRPPRCHSSLRRRSCGAKVPFVFGAVIGSRARSAAPRLTSGAAVRPSFLARGTLAESEGPSPGRRMSGRCGVVSGLSPPPSCWRWRCRGSPCGDWGQQSSTGCADLSGGTLAEPPAGLRGHDLLVLLHGSRGHARAA